MGEINEKLKVFQMEVDNLHYPNLFDSEDNKLNFYQGLDNLHLYKPIRFDSEDNKLNFYQGLDNLHINKLSTLEFDSFVLTKPKEDSLTSILGKYDYSSLVTKGNDFLSITEKGYNFDNLQKINYLFGDVASFAMQAVNGKFDNYSFENVATQVTKDLVSIDFKALNKIADEFAEWIGEMENEAQILIEQFAHYLRKEGKLIPKDVQDFLHFWLGYNEKYLGLRRENRNKFKLHENDLLLYHSCKEVKLKMRLETIYDAFDMVWKTVDKRNQKQLPPSPATPLLESDISEIEKNENPTNEKKPVTTEIQDSIKHLFVKISDYNTIQDLLVVKEILEPNSFLFKDTKKGNKSFCVAIILDLYYKRYLHKKPKPEQIKFICETDFGLEIGLDTIKRTKRENFKIDFIPVNTQNTN